MQHIDYTVAILHFDNGTTVELPKVDKEFSEWFKSGIVDDLNEGGFQRIQDYVINSRRLLYVTFRVDKYASPERSDTE